MYTAQLWGFADSDMAQDCSSLVSLLYLIATFAERSSDVIASLEGPDINILPRRINPLLCALP